MKDHLDLSATQHQRTVGQNYPIERNGDGHDGYLFFDSGPESTILEGCQLRRVSGYHTSFRVDHKALAGVERLHCPEQGSSATCQLRTVDRNMKSLVHEPKDGDTLHLVLADENTVHRCEAHGGDIQVREMISAKDILATLVQPRPALNFKWYEAKDKKNPGPKPVKYPHQAVLTGEGDRDEEKREK